MWQLTVVRQIIKWCIDFCLSYHDCCWIIIDKTSTNRWMMCEGKACIRYPDNFALSETLSHNYWLTHWQPVKRCVSIRIPYHFAHILSCSGHIRPTSTYLVIEWPIKTQQTLCARTHGVVHRSDNLQGRSHKKSENPCPTARSLQPMHNAQCSPCPTSPPAALKPFFSALQ